MGRSPVRANGDVEIAPGGIPEIFLVKCLAPVYVSSRKRKRDDGSIELVDAPMVRACRKCAACLVSRRAEQISLVDREAAMWAQLGRGSTLFTLTFSDEGLAEHGDAPSVKHLQAFLRRVRWHLGKGIRYVLLSERSEENTKRLHYHGVLFGVDPVRCEQVIKDAWPFGFADADLRRSVGYALKYVYKQWEGAEKHLYLFSRKPRIGFYKTQELMASRSFAEQVREYGDIPGVYKEAGPGGDIKRTVGRYTRRKLRQSLGLPDREVSVTAKVGAAWREEVVRKRAAPYLDDRGRLGSSGRARVVKMFQDKDGARAIVQRAEALKGKKAAPSSLELEYQAAQRLVRRSLE